MSACFVGFDLSGFWKDSDYARQEYVEPAPTAEMIASIEAELGYRLPASYIALMRTQNGGIPVNTCHPTAEPTSWADDHVAISGFQGIGRSQTFSLCGALGSLFHIEEWGYPPIGVYFGDCPSAGHDLLALDYRACGPEGEPQVVHVDQEDDYRITFVARTFEDFVRGLRHDSAYGDAPDGARQQALERVLTAPFSRLLAQLCAAHTDPAMPRIVRQLAAAIVADQDTFILQDDARSHLMYDVQMMLYSHSRTVKSLDAYIQAYPSMLTVTLGNEFGTGGWGPDFARSQAPFIRDWWQARVAAGQFVQTAQGWRLTPAYEAELARQLAPYG